MHHKRTESQASKVNDVIVIGAGLSGLSAAKVCHDKGLNVLVLEARDRVGGRTLSDENGCDLGGSYFIHEHRNLFNLIAELGLKCQADVPAAIGGVPTFYSNNLKAKSYSKDPTQVPFASKYNLLARLDFIATKRKINDMCIKIDLNEPWNSKDAHKLDSISFKQFILDTCYTAQVKNYFLNFIAPINMTNEAEDFSLLYALCFIRSWGGIDKCIGMDGSGSTCRVVGGSQLISIRLCQQIGEERILLNKPVHTIDQQTNSEIVSVITKDSCKYEGYRVIVALPPNLQTSITFKPNIPLKSQLNHRTPAGLCTKVILYYDKAYWQDNGFNGHVFVLDHRQINNDDSENIGARFKRGRRCTKGSNTANINSNSNNGNNNNNGNSGLKRSNECRRSICKTSSSSMTASANSGGLVSSSLEKEENMYASTNSLQVPSNNGDRNNLMLKETKESYYPSSGMNILDEEYCPITFATPDYSRGQPSLIAHICGSAWINYHQIEKQEDRISLVAKSYAKILHPDLMEPLSFKELNWVSEEYSRGAYTSIMTPGTMTKFGRTLGAPFGRIAFAGTELSTYWPFTMEGAIRSGRKAALKILKDLKREDIHEEDIVDDEEVLVQNPESFLIKNSSYILYLTKLALAAPTFIILLGALGFSLHKINIRLKI